MIAFHEEQLDDVASEGLWCLVTPIFEIREIRPQKEIDTTEARS
jgi:hypothetical protein